MHPLELFRNMSSTVPAAALFRLLLAVLLGGIIGLERELKHRPAGLRTNMFICFGSAMFTLLSYELSGGHEPTRIAAQIIPGIGFIGAGSILHARGLVNGLTTAATLFVVASVGMAVGGGLYVTAIFATLVVLLVLYALGRFEDTFNLKIFSFGYEVTAKTSEELITEVNSLLEADHRMMDNVRVAQTQQHSRVQFTVDGTFRESARLLAGLRGSEIIERVYSAGPTEHE
jgi:putative Mg2+ transporter-C (MgtC) family protein